MMNESRYYIVGSDGKKYGPVSAAKLREWVQQGRVDSRTAVFIEGATEWTFVGLLPEFAPEQPAGPPPVIGGLPPQPIAGTNGFAIWGLICGLLSWTFCGCCVPFAILGLVFSIIALAQISSSAQEGRGFAIAGVVLSATNLLWTFGLTLFGMMGNNMQSQWLAN